MVKKSMTRQMKKDKAEKKIQNGSQISSIPPPMLSSRNNSFASNSSTPKKVKKTKRRRSIGSHHFRTLNDHYRKIVRIEHFMSRLGINFECEIINCKFTGD